MSLPDWCYNGPNPIINYAVAVEFRAPLPQTTLKAISTGHAKVRGDLPRRVEQPSITFQMAGPQLRFGGAPLTPTPIQGLGGVIFDTLNPDGTMRAALAVNPMSVTYMTSHYPRWVEFWPVAERLFEVVVEMISPAPQISSLTLNAINKFRPCESAVAPLLDSLISRHSPYIAPNLLTSKGFGHSFHGFVKDSVDPDGQTTINVNVGWSPGADKKTEVDITFQLRRSFVSPLSAATVFDQGGGISCELLGTLFLDLHKQNNQMFQEVVDHRICSQIPGLNK
jgi:uncharacterized protein (TIGR04255 family)